MVYVLWILLHGPKRPFLSILVYILHILNCLGQDMQVLYYGRAPRTKEILPDFLKWHRITRPPLVFRGLTGSQRTPGFWGVTRGNLKVCLREQRCLPKGQLQSNPSRVISPLENRPSTYGKFVMEKDTKAKNKQRIFIDEFPSVQILYFPK